MLSARLFSKSSVLSRTNLDLMLQHLRQNGLLLVCLTTQNLRCKTTGLRVLETHYYFRSVTKLLIHILVYLRERLAVTEMTEQYQHSAG